MLTNRDYMLIASVKIGTLGEMENELSKLVIANLIDAIDEGILSDDSDWPLIAGAVDIAIDTMLESYPEGCKTSVGSSIENMMDEYESEFNRAKREFNGL